MVYGTSNVPQHDIGNHLGPCSTWGLSLCSGGGFGVSKDSGSLRNGFVAVSYSGLSDSEDGHTLTYWWLVGNMGVFCLRIMYYRDLLPRFPSNRQ